MICAEISSFWERRKLALMADEGFRFGDTSREVTGILVCWKPTLSAIQAAVTAGCNLIVTHEELNFPPMYAGADFETGLTATTYHRVKALVEGKITVFRAHSSLDFLCILDSFGEALGLSNPQFFGEYASRIYEIPPTRLGTLCEQVKAAMGLSYLRVSGDLEKPVSRVGLLWGGVGISANPNFLQDCLQNGADVLIGGECEEIPFLAARDAGVGYIETSHAYSENPGLRKAAKLLTESFPVSVHFFENKRPWRLWTGKKEGGAE